MTVDESSYSYEDYDSFLQLIEQQLARYHDSIFIRYQPSKAELEFKSVTYGQFNRIANYQARKWSPSLTNVTTVAFLGDEPIQCMLAMLAAFKLRKQFFAISTRVPEELITKLLKDTKTQYMFVSEDHQRTAEQSIQTLSDVQVNTWTDFDVEKLIELSKDDDDNKFDHFVMQPASKTDIILVLHSSGSTGTPKPIYLSNQYLLVIVQVFKTESQHTWGKNGVDSSDALSILVPLFHSSGVMSYWISMMFGAHSVIFRELPASPQNILSVLEKEKITVLLAAPMSLKAMAEYIRNNNVEDSETAAFDRIKFSMFGGDQLVMGAGEYLRSRGLNVRCAHGITETGFVAIADMSKENEAWYTVKPVADFLEYYRWEEVDEGIYHCLIHKNCPGLSPKAPITLEDAYYETTDLFREEPLGSGTYRHIGRNTDVLTMSDGRKVYPTLAENELRGCNIVKGCTVIGDGRSHTAMLVETDAVRTANYTPEEVKAEVDAAVEAANNQLPEDALIVPKLIYIVPKGRSLKTITKGTVSRKLAMIDFKEEIDKLYNDFLLTEA